MDIAFVKYPQNDVDGKDRNHKQEREAADRFFKGLEDSVVDGFHPLGRRGTLEEAAAAVLWLCSPQASFITGIALPVDGGLTAR